MNEHVFYGILIPFLGTSLGAACVFFMKKTLKDVIVAMELSDATMRNIKQNLLLSGVC